jgi:single-stranded DNA-binding protein
MKSNLNSVIIEGTVTTVAKSDDQISFDMSVIRYYRIGEEILKEESVFTVVAYGKLAEVNWDKLKVNREIRVVGRLRSVQYVPSPYPMVELVAEHIEVKPDEKEEEDAE